MSLFNHIQPRKKFNITIKSVAKMLGIPPNVILRIEMWNYVLFVHRSDIGGQFISYRKLRHWQNAVACKIQSCVKKEQLLMLWLSIKNDGKKYAKQYKEAYHVFVERVCTQQWQKIAIGEGGALNSQSQGSKK